MRLDGHKVDTEDPNLFLRLLQEQHQDIWQDVWRNNNKYVICIPQSVSLRHRVRREDIENHVLRAAPFGGGDYTTLNGKRVGLAGGELVTKQTGAAQWADERRVRIICTEDLGNPSDQGGGADGDGGGDGARCVKQFTGASHNFEQTLLRCSWSADGAQVGCGSSDRNAYVWDFDTATLMYQLPGHKGAVNEVAFHPKEPIVGSCSSDKTIFLGEVAA